MYNEVAGGVATKILWTECAVLFVRWSPNNKLASRRLRPSFESGHQYLSVGNQRRLRENCALWQSAVIYIL